MFIKSCTSKRADIYIIDGYLFMEGRFIGVLQCPECGKSNFEIFIFTKTETLRYSCNGSGKVIMDKTDSMEYNNGIILCGSCRSWYPVKDEIPVMLRRELRDNQKDKQFLETYKNNIPEDINYIYK
jgi:uncharacterized protein YbaR (Trm112 family)